MNSVTQIRQNVMFALKYNCLPYDVIISDVNRYLSTSLRAFVALWRFPTQEDLRRVGERFAGGLALILSVKALQTSRQLMLLKLGLLLSSRRRNARANDEAYPIFRQHNTNLLQRKTIVLSCDRMAFNF